ncbi:ESX secretion-associated protein EspG [Pseudonocardia sp. HH130630-07]|uniref:ESX secretion-associated protein EspG n=1 Tax=Pseudonocardia sp. HH130630-07 TaxID=1690815 RepID=UPI000814E913|nr:ESX secretion-associated protein EspG [Pseudonocardia sp. HH130630-07]ANY07528.1 hypothetical protein AFB00_15885 [Pseudonocardia sp. HH130630-07]
MAEPYPWNTTARFEMSGAEFDVVWEHLGLGALPVALRLPSPGRTFAERRRVTAAGLDGLRGRGLAGPGGTEPALVRLLGLLARPARQLELRGWFGSPLRAIAAERDDDGVLVVHTGGRVTISAAGTPAYAATSALPSLPAGPGPAIGLPTPVLAAVLDGTGTGTAAPADGLGPVPPVDAATGLDAERLAALLRGPADRAQVCAVRFDRWGSPARLPGHVAVVDTRYGRYRLSRGPGPHGGAEWSTLAPADERSLPPQLAALFDTQSRSECCIS